MPRVLRAKLANSCAAIEPPKSPKLPFNNGKKRITGRGQLSPSGTLGTRAEFREKTDSAGPGTVSAIKDKVLSAATTAPAAGQITRTRANRKIGGNTVAPITKVERDRRGRRSTELRLSEVRNIMAAAVFTAQEHRPLNRHTTIHFDKCGIADPVAALRRYTKLARDWLKTQCAPFAYIWVRESGDGKGEHAHLLMYVPPGLASAFARRERSWRKLIGAKRALRSFRSTPVGRSYRHAEVGIQHGEQYEDHLREIVGYLVKGAEPRAVAALHLMRAAPGGELWGKRSGMSENINRAARARAAIK